MATRVTALVALSALTLAALTGLAGGLATTTAATATSTMLRGRVRNAHPRGGRSPRWSNIVLKIIFMVPHVG